MHIIIYRIVVKSLKTFQCEKMKSGQLHTIILSMYLFFFNLKQIEQNVTNSVFLFLFIHREYFFLIGYSSL